jgi:hypothetical protein
MSRAAGCKCGAKISRIDPANLEVKNTHWKGYCDSDCSNNEEEYRSEVKAEQNATMFHQLLYVASHRQSVGEIVWADGEQ